MSLIIRPASSRLNKFIHSGSAALAASSCSIVITSAEHPHNTIVYANAAFTAMSGYALSDIIGRSCCFLYGPLTSLTTIEDIDSAIEFQVGIRRQMVNYHRDGTHFWTDVAIDPIHDASGGVTGYVRIHIPVEKTIPEAPCDTGLAAIAEHIPGYVYRRVMRADGTIEIIYTSPSLRRLLGVPDGAEQRPFYEYVHRDDHDELMDAVRRSAASMSLFREEFRLMSGDGASHWMRSDAPPRRMENGEIVWDGLAIEISPEKRWESEIAQQALRDPLTGLLTRAAWRQTLELHLSATKRGDGGCGIMFVDIAEFAALNHRLGQRAGDEVLREVALRLAAATEAVAGVSARLGGDEFAVLIPNFHADLDLTSINDIVTEALCAPMRIGLQQVQVQCCIGAALHLDAGADEHDIGDLANEIMKQAELALRWSKQSGQGDTTVYSTERDDRFRNQPVLARSLEQAIALGELELHYQPLVDLASGKIISAEALVRWNHPTLGIQRPDLFIPMAEELGLIVELGRWVLERAFEQSKCWRNAGLTPPPIAINVSGRQLVDPSFVSLVEGALLSSGADAGDFEFELTEGMLIEPSPQIVASLHALQRLGFTITIDDFGSGHATFRYLRDFPIDKIKIDQIFVRKLVVGSTDALIIRAVIALARSMGVSFVAEGIETEMQRDFLLREGCEIGQGYLFSMPLLAEDFAWMLGSGARLPLRLPEREAEKSIDFDLEGQIT